MLTHREFSAWIVSEGRPLPEYLVAVDGNASKVSCWIPSETGKSFSVHWKDEGSRIHSCAFIALDGFQVPGRFLTGYGETSREGIRTGSNTERPFKFVERPSTSSKGQIIPNAGTIVLKIRLVTIDGTREANKLQQLPEHSRPHSSMSRQCIGYGEERRAYEQFPQTWRVKPYDGSSNRSYVTFVFRYRPREFLLSQGIMPMDDTPKIPSAVIRESRTNRRVASAPASISMLMTPSPTPSPQQNDLERMVQDAALQNAFGPGSIYMQTVNTNAMACRYPGERTLDFSVGESRPSMPM